MSDYRLTDIEAKSGLGLGPLPEPFMVSLYRALAPYRGCGHGCLYCDGRAEKYYVEGEFERDIAVRRNAAELIARDVAAGKAALEYGSVCFGSGVTDAYQPAEAELGLTRRTLEALAPTGLPLVILTKSALARRDFDLIARFPRALVMVTLTTLDEGLASWLEPGASPPAERLELVRAARDAGFMAGIMAMPLCPGLSDGPEASGALFKAARDSGAQFAYPGGLTLRPGRQKDIFMRRLAGEKPDLVPLYERLYRENRQSGSPDLALVRPAYDGWLRALSELGLPSIIPWDVYSKLLALPDALYVFLCHLEDLYARRGVDIRPLRAARERYASWLKEAKAALRRQARRAARNEAGAEASLFADADARPSSQDMAENHAAFPLSAELSRRLDAELESILQNGRLAALCRPFLSGEAGFDYVGLGLTYRQG